MNDDAGTGPDGEMITFRDHPHTGTAGDGAFQAPEGSGGGGRVAGTPGSATTPMEMSPSMRRRDFVRTLAAAGMLGIAGCAGGGPGTTTTGADGDGGAGQGGGSGTGTAPGGGPGGTGGAPGSGNPLVLEADRPFVLPAGTVDSTFDVDLTPETVMLEGPALDAVIEVDPDDQRYVLDATRLAASGLSLSEGSVMWLSGVALRRVTGVERDGDRLTVETEFAALNEAISDGEVAWDAELDYGAGQVVTELADRGAGGGSGDSIRPLAAGQATLVDVSMLDTDGEEWPVREFSQSGGSISWTFQQSNREYTFGLTPGSDVTELKAEVKAPVSGPVGGNPNVRLTGIGRLESVTSTASASFSGGDVSSMDYRANQLAGELKLDIVSAGSGAYDFQWDFPGAMFKWIVFVGALPVTITVTTALVAKVFVPANTMAKAVSKYSYDGTAGFTYDGTDVSTKGQFPGFGFDPDAGDSSSYPGLVVDLQFGVLFPKMSVSLFGTFLVPYLALEMYIGSSLEWGPVCKRSYVRMVAVAGYDLTALGVNLSNGKEVLVDRQERATGDSCPAN